MGGRRWVALDQTPLHGQFFPWWVSVANGKYCKTEYLMKSIEYQMAVLTMDHESIPQVKQPENPMKSIEYRWLFFAPLQTCWNLLTCGLPARDATALLGWNLREPAGRLEPLQRRRQVPK